MKLSEGGNFRDIEEVRNFDFTKDGYCTYKGIYFILLISFFNEHGSSIHNAMKRLATRASQEGLEFPQNFNSDAKYFLCTMRGTPYDNSKNYNRCYFNNIEEVIEAMKDTLNESMKSKIRFALTEDSIARKRTKWDSDTNPNNYQLDIFLRKSGYRLIDIIPHEKSPELIIEAIKSDHLHPEITHHVAEGIFYINVKKYGELSASDVQELMKGYQTAIEVIHHLTELDLSKLEYEKEKSEDEK